MITGEWEAQSDGHLRHVCGSGGTLLLLSVPKSGSEAVQVPSNSLPHGASNMHNQTARLAREETWRNLPDIQPRPCCQLTQEPFSSFPALQRLPELTGSLQSTALSAPPCTRACPDSLQKHWVGAGKKGPTV